MNDSVKNKVDSRYIKVISNISAEEFKQKYGNVFNLFYDAVNSNDRLKNLPNEQKEEIAVARAQAYMVVVMKRESSNDPTLQNPYGFTGWFQMKDISLSETDYVKKNSEGQTVFTKKAADAVKAIKEGEIVDNEAMKRFFNNTPESHAVQVDAFLQYTNKVVTYKTTKATINELVGKNDGYKVKFKGEEYDATLEGALMATHLLGHAGADKSLVRGKGGADRNGTTAEEYVATASGQFKNTDGSSLYFDREAVFNEIIRARGRIASNNDQQPVLNNQSPNTQSTPNKTIENPYPITEDERIKEMQGFFMILAMIVNALAEPEKQQSVPILSTNTITPPLTTPSSNLVANVPAVNHR
jgi:hypothetical protein